MTYTQKQIVCIPARAGSKRIRSKNLRDFCGKPLIAYAIENALNVFEPGIIYVNSDSAQMLNLAGSYGVCQYERDAKLASDESTGDEFMYDFIKNNDADICVMLNPVCPLIKPDDITRALKTFETNDCDTLISCCNTQMQVFCDKQPVNIYTNKNLEPTQNNPVVSILNWAVTIWCCRSFKSRYEKHGYAYIGNKRVLFEIEALRAIKISHEQDFRTAEAIYRSER